MTEEDAMKEFEEWWNIRGKQRLNYTDFLDIKSMIIAAFRKYHKEVST